MTRRACCLLLLSFFGVLHLASASHSLGYGVGFSLSQNYGTASIYFANGSSVGVARIQAGGNYMVMMKAEEWILPQNYNRISDHVRPLQPLGAPGLWDTPRDRMTPWLDHSIHSQQEEALYDMLEVLQCETEQYLESKITAVNIGFPVQPSRMLQISLNVAAGRLSLYQPNSWVSTAGTMAMSAKVAERNIDCYGQEPKKLVLAVDYGRSAMTATLFSADEGVFDNLLGLHNTTLGAFEWVNSYNETRANIVSELRRLVEKPVQTPYGEWLHGVDDLILIGESGRDPRLLSALEEVFPPEEKAEAVSMSISGDCQVVDPAFAAAEGMAYWNLEHLIDESRGDFCSVPIFPLRGESKNFSRAVTKLLRAALDL